MNNQPSGDRDQSNSNLEIRNNTLPELVTNDCDLYLLNMAQFLLKLEVEFFVPASTV